MANKKKTQARPKYLKYVGHGAFLFAPARDLYEEEIAALTNEEYAILVNSGMYGELPLPPESQVKEGESWQSA